MTDSHPAPDNLRALFREALAWGMVYGPEIPAHQWDEMRESMVKQYTSRAVLAYADSVTAPAATVIKKGAERQWMSERLGHLPDGIYSLYLAPPTQPAPASQWDALLAATSTALEVLQKHRQMKGDWPMGELGRRAAEELQAARHAIFNTARAAQEGK